ncbi:monovalent cation/H(+) antiporter subunit G [Massilia sp. BSC265]|uniref:monovalent cation/H(+) antiporter subunit G n=1 Tax=Massilia sp. BSC265 TaxID=1549812 RepID=UPI00068E65FC|nr:monovalent cation/H(+) antiporter subunit G [Massilia sp. BSC265]
MTVLGWALVILGAALLAVAALGLLRLPDALSRQHAATKAATLALGVMLAGLAVLQPSFAWWIRIGLLVLLLVLTVPVASHALARAAASRPDA